MNKLIGDRYLIVKKIGSGGMADVYLAMDTVLEREVALKQLRGDLSHDPVALLRFQREANAASGLNHPSIVDVYDVGEDDGQHYIVMEMVRGITLKELIHRRGGLDKYEAVAIMQQLSSALLTAHQANIIHRDIKPQNILVKADGTVKITDFGIALAGDALQLTKSDSVLGSVHYMAPECSRGEGASEQSDVYSLGVVFYELLTGEIPYRGETPVEIAMKHMREAFPSIHAFNPTLPNSLVNIIAKATHKNRLHRYPNMQALYDDLQTCLLESRANESLWEPELEGDDGTKIIEKLDRVGEPIEAKKNHKRRNIIIATLLAVLFISGVAWMVFKPQSSKQFEIPDVKGKSLTEAREVLTASGLNVTSISLYESSEEFEQGLVINTKPTIGTMASKGDQIKLVVSQGKVYTIGDYTGKSLSEVKAELSSTNVNIRIETEFNKDVPIGNVIRQSGLKPNEKIYPNQRYDLILVVSSENELFLPNNFMGKGLDEAEKLLNDLGVKTERQKISVDGLSANEIKQLSFETVIRSNPMPGSYYVQSEGNTVTLFYYSSEDKPKEIPEKPDDKDEKPSENDEGNRNRSPHD